MSNFAVFHAYLHGTRLYDALSGVLVVGNPWIISNFLILYCHFWPMFLESPDGAWPNRKKIP
jgi:hypothetical protein